MTLAFHSVSNKMSGTLAVDTPMVYCCEVPFANSDSSAYDALPAGSCDLVVTRCHSHK